jgi:hypothetical protein
MTWAGAPQSVRKHGDGDVGSETINLAMDSGTLWRGDGSHISRAGTAVAAEYGASQLGVSWSRQMNNGPVLLEFVDAGARLY